MNPTFLRNILSSQFANRFLAALILTFSTSHQATANDTSDAPASPSYELVGIARLDGISYASLIDLQTGYHFLLSTINKSEQGLVLTSVKTDEDPSGPSVTILKDGVSLLLSLDGSAPLEQTDASSSPLPVASVNPSPEISTDGAVNASKLKLPPGATLPLVFQEVDPKKMTLTDDQKATLNQLRQDFINAIAGTNAANTATTGATNIATTGAANTATAGETPTTADSPVASTPETANSNTPYQNWVSAQKQSDETFRMLFGTQAFVAYSESSSYPTPP